MTHELLRCWAVVTMGCVCETTRQEGTLNAHAGTKPLLFREFLELLVRIAKAKFVHNEPTAIPEDVDSSGHAGEEKYECILMIYCELLEALLNL